jgi:hypothetical protein
VYLNIAFEILSVLSLISNSKEHRHFSVPKVVLNYIYSRLKLQKTTCHLQQHFFNIFEPNKGTKGPENHSLD